MKREKKPLVQFCTFPVERNFLKIPFLVATLKCFLAKFLLIIFK